MNPRPARLVVRRRPGRAWSTAIPRKSNSMPRGVLPHRATKGYNSAGPQELLCATKWEPSALTKLSWFPATVLESLEVERNGTWRFRQADGTILVVVAEPGDQVLLGSRSLEGLNFRVEPVTKRLVDAGPAPAAVGLRLAI